MPDVNAVLPTSMVVGAAAKGTAPIKNINFYLNGKYEANLSGSSGAVALTLPQQGTPYTLRAVATDSAGNHYSASKKVVADYTYDQFSCMGSGCIPGIYAVAPLDEAYVGSSFDLNMQIRQNPNPISAMRAYLDNNVIATSNRPRLQQQVTVAVPAPTYSQFKAGIQKESSTASSRTSTSTSTYPSDRQQIGKPFAITPSSGRNREFPVFFSVCACGYA